MSRQFASASSQYAVYASGIGGSAFTFACWIYRASSGASHVPIARSVSSGTVGTSLLTVNASNVLQLYAETANAQSANISGGTTFSANTWYHIAGVFAAGDYRIYLNGTLENSSAHGNAPAAANEIAISGRVYAGSRGDYFDGAVADVAQWTAALSPSEIMELARFAKRPPDVRPSRLNGYWYPRRDAKGTTDRDCSGFGCDMVPTNSPTWGDDPPQTKQRRRRRVGVAVSLTGVAAVTVGALSASGVGTFTNPVFAAVAVAAVAGTRSSGLGTFVSPVFTASAGMMISAALASGAATFLAANVAVAAVSAGSVSGSGSASFIDPTYAGSGLSVSGGVLGSGSASFTNPVFSAAGVVAAGVALGAGIGTTTVPVYVGTADTIVGRGVAAGSATFVAPIYASTASVAISGAVGDGVAIFDPYVVIGVSAVVIGATGGSGTGAFIATVQAVAGVAVAAAQAEGSGVVTDPVYRADGSLGVAGAVVVATAAFERPVYRGASSAVSGAFVASGSVSFAVPVYDGDIAAVAGPVVGAGSGLYGIFLSIGAASVVVGAASVVVGAASADGEYLTLTYVVGIDFVVSDRLWFVVADDCLSFLVVDRSDWNVEDEPLGLRVPAGAGQNVPNEI